jgi:hypothetical protein
MYEPRIYRQWVEGKDLVPFNVIVRETDLYIRATTNLKRKAQKLVVKYRSQLEKYIKQYPSFLTSLQPLPVAPDAPHIVKQMAEAAQKAGVGPMASVAGAIAELVGEELSAFSPEIIVENGGDIYLKSLKKRIVGIYAGKSPLNGKIGLEISAPETPLGICTSSGTVGHSLSFGQADAVVVLSKSATLADAAATAIGNLIKKPTDIPSGIEFAKAVKGVEGVILIKDSSIGVWGKVKLCQI